MDVDSGRSNGSVSKKGLNGEQIGPVFIKMSAESMPKGMAGDAPGPAESNFMLMNVTGKEKGIDGTIGIGLLREEPAFRFVIFKPVVSENIKSERGKLSVTVIAVFTMSHMYPHIPSVDIFISEMTELADAQTRRIHKSDHSLDFKIR